jgi:hypothetical protein
MSSTLIKSFISLCFLLSTHSLWAQSPSFESGSRQIALIELYSSEGCSSCPPADRWVARLKEHQKLWTEFIPLNFHVDYWNRLGWVDRFSHQQFTQRQHRFAGEWGSGRVYTPGFVLNGQEWRIRSTQQLLGKSVGVLKATPRDNKTYHVQFSPEVRKQGSYKVHVALLGHGLSTDVKYGENAGETLQHEFVVLKTYARNMTKQGAHFTANLKVPENKSAGAPKMSLVFWVSAEGSQKPIQAVGGYL